MLRRLIALSVLLWLLGFVWFATTLPGPAGKRQTDAVVVLTGGTGRVAHGVKVLRQGQARSLFVSGVDKDVKPHEFAVQYQVTTEDMACCVKLGFDATNTRSNGNETARWVSVNKIRSVRLVTNDWHMRRAQYEIGRVIPAGVVVVPDAVPSEPSLKTLFAEYHKLLARRLSDIGGA